MEIRWGSYGISFFWKHLGLVSVWCPLGIIHLGLQFKPWWWFFRNRWPVSYRYSWRYDSYEVGVWPLFLLIWW